MNINKKIIRNYKKLKEIRLLFKNKKIGLCHGVFDIFHNGHVSYLEESKKKTDILVVSITSDYFVNKGFNKPHNSELKRMNILKHIDLVDYVFMNNAETSENVIKNLKPNFYFKGKDYLKKDLSNNLKKEIKVLKKFKGKFAITNTELMSSTKIFNTHFSKIKTTQKKFLKEISANFDHYKITESLEKLKNEEINIIGEPIIDCYTYGNIAGLTSKDPNLSILKKKRELVGGGILAAAKIASTLVKKVNLYTYGNNNILKKFLKNYKNISVINLNSKKQIQIKDRILNFDKSEKFIQITNFGKNSFLESEKKIILKKLKKIKKNLVIIDYGLGLFENEVLDYINKIKFKKYINVQTNSINYGYNLFNKYTNYNYLCLNEKEWKLGFKINDINVCKNIIIKKSKKNTNFAITEGVNGSSFISNKKSFNAPSFFNNPLDTTGCGDSYFIITSLSLMAKIEASLVPVLGNIYAGNYSMHLGNKHIIDKRYFFSEIKNFLNY
jgi:rfaE bifunctional protein nucleotidyltransferase chain/domain